MRKIPDDPFTKSADTWQTVPAEPDPGNPSAEPGIYDVKSGRTGPVARRHDLRGLVVVSSQLSASALSSQLSARRRRPRSRPARFAMQTGLR